MTVRPKPTRTLTDVLLSRRISEERKATALVSAARELGKLHARGYLHTSPHTDRFLVSRNMAARIMGTIRTRRARNSAELEEEKNKFIQAFGIEIGMNYRKMQQEYEKELRKRLKNR